MSASRKVSKLEYLLAIGIRFALVHSSFKTSLQDRVEISTPLNSWRRLLEGICLFNKGVDPYSGDLFHESPLTLIFFRGLLQYTEQWLEVFFISVDVLTAYILYVSARIYVGQLKSEEDKRRDRGEQQSFIVACILIVTSVLGPTVWHLWIYSDSANANFYFGMTLAFATAQIFLITDLLFAHKKRDFALKHGLPEDPSKSVLVLE
ncbi:UNVERIFIED_CONTAM: hypothetical protein PYX00_010355 [Menopon gallinae]|uniref:Uncharacterized protein n=1 Tax=Menopon gallinae TaxID=328185 RepID=A0AAW2HFL5_9NEOP